MRTAILIIYHQLIAKDPRLLHRQLQGDSLNGLQPVFLMNRRQDDHTHCPFPVNPRKSTVSKANHYLPHPNKTAP